MLYVLPLVSYGFEVIGVREIGSRSLARDKVGVIKYYLASLVSRLSIYMLLALGLIAASAIYKGGQFLFLTAIWLLHPLGVLLQSNFYFQALNNNKYFSLLLVAARVVALVLTYIFVGEGDILLASAFAAGSFLFSGVIAASSVLIMNWRHATARGLLALCMNQYKQGFHLATGNTYVAMFRGSNVLILSMLAAPVAVMMYSLAEKMIKVLQAAIMPLNMYYQNKLNAWFDGCAHGVSSELLRKEIWRRTYGQLGIALLLSVISISGVAIASAKVEAIGAVFSTEQLVLTLLMLFAIFFGICNYMFGAVGLILLGQGRLFSRYVFASGVISLAFSFLGARFGNVYVVALAYVLGEAVLLGSSLRAYNRREMTV